jgi:hypothetical protein
LAQTDCGLFKNKQCEQIINGICHKRQKVHGFNLISNINHPKNEKRPHSPSCYVYHDKQAVCSGTPNVKELCSS